MLLEETSDCIKILALTGIRSEYDLLYPLLNELNQSCHFDLGMIVSGAHLTATHNYSVTQIEQDGFHIVERIENLICSNSVSSKLDGTGALIQGLSIVLEKENPDLLMVLGDREESVACALAGTYMQIPVVHLAGGDATFTKEGNVDEEIRHATTKLSHIHFAMADEHKERIIKLGEQSWRVHTVGSGGLDKIRLVPTCSRQELAQTISSEIKNDYCVFIYHPLSSYSQEQTQQEVSYIFDAAIELGLTIFVGAPNSDPGNTWVTEIIQRHAQSENVVLYNNLPRFEFTNLLRHARCLVGNSSLGIHEAGYIGLPVVNVGERQRGRLTDNNVVFVSGEFNEIKSALDTASFDEKYRVSITREASIYGDGYMVKKSMEVLLNLPSRKALLNKTLTY